MIGYGGSQPSSTGMHRFLDYMISHNVTIGSTGTCQGVPVLGDRVHVGTGAVILGPFTLVTML